MNEATMNRQLRHAEAMIEKSWKAGDVYGVAGWTMHRNLLGRLIWNLRNLDERTN